jgi:hypothetical protein
MAQYADNLAYIKIDSVEVQAYFKNVKLSPSNNSIDTTVGSGTDHVQRQPGLDDTKIDISLGYDTAQLQTYIQKLKVGQIVTIEYGPESNVSGKPRHVQAFNITKADHEVNVDKSHTLFDLSGEGSAAASISMFSGGVYA